MLPFGHVTLNYKAYEYLSTYYLLSINHEEVLN